MSKKIYTIAAAALLLFGVTSCTTLNQALSTGNTGTAVAAGGNILDNLLGSVLGSQPITERELVGRWGYTGVSTVFESQSFLAQAGGVAAAGVLEAKLDENLTRFGFKKGSTTFVFNADHTFEANLNGMPISGTYTLAPNKKVLHLSKSCAPLPVSASFSIATNSSPSSVPPVRSPAAWQTLVSAT